MNDPEWVQQRVAVEGIDKEGADMSVTGQTTFSVRLLKEATGPWVQIFNRLAKEQQGPELELTAQPHVKLIKVDGAAAEKPAIDRAYRQVMAIVEEANIEYERVRKARRNFIGAINDVAIDWD